MEFEIGKLPNIRIDIVSLRLKTERFYNCCILKNNFKNNLFRLAEAKTYLYGCIHLLKAMIEDYDNEFITEYKLLNTNLDEQIDKYFENFLSRIDAEQKELTKSIKNSDIVGDLTLPSAVKNFMESMIDIMENVILRPLYDAMEIYKVKQIETSSTIMSKDDTFRYILFRKVLDSAKISGSEKRQKVAISTGSQGASFQDTKIFKQPTIQDTKINKKDVPVTEDDYPINDVDISPAEKTFDELFTDLEGEKDDTAD